MKYTRETEILQKRLVGKRVLSPTIFIVKNLNLFSADPTIGIRHTEFFISSPQLLH